MNGINSGAGFQNFGLRGVTISGVRSGATPLEETSNISAVSNFFQRYLIGSWLGEGSQGKVFAAKNVRTRSSSAIKFPNTCPRCVPSSNLRKEDWIRIFDREIEKLQSIQGVSHIVRLKDTIPGEYGSSIVMDLTAPDAWQQIQNGRTWNKFPLFSVARQALEGLNDLQKAGLIHTDFKPQNISIDENNQLTMLDAESVLRERDAKPSDLVTSFWYRAPERFLTDQPYSFPISMWGLGCTLFQLYTGNFFVAKGVNDDLHGRQVQFEEIKKELEENEHFVARWKQRIYEAASKKGETKQDADEIISVLSNMFELDPQKRLTAQQGLQLPFLRSDIAFKIDMSFQSSAPLILRLFDENSGAPRCLWSRNIGNDNTKYCCYHVPSVHNNLYSVEIEYLNNKNRYQIYVSDGGTIKIHAPPISLSQEPSSGISTEIVNRIEGCAHLHIFDPLNYSIGREVQKGSPSEPLFCADLSAKGSWSVRLPQRLNNSYPVEVVDLTNTLCHIDRNTEIGPNSRIEVALGQGNRLTVRSLQNS